MQLYKSYQSTCSGKVRLVLEEKRQDYEEIEVNLRKGEQFEDAYLAMNPKAVVPTLVHDGKVYRESSAICEYLDDAIPEPPMKPADAAGRYQMRLWTKFIDEEIHSMTTIVTYAVALRHELIANNTPEQIEAHFAAMPDPKTRENQMAVHYDGTKAPAFIGAIKMLDSMVGRAEASLEQSGGPWLAGETYSLADAAVTPYMFRLNIFTFSEMWTENRPCVTEWWERIQARDNYRGVVSPDTPEAGIEHRRASGEKAWPEVKMALNGPPSS